MCNNSCIFEHFDPMTGETECRLPKDHYCPLEVTTAICPYCEEDYMDEGQEICPICGAYLQK